MSSRPGQLQRPEIRNIPVRGDPNESLVRSGGNAGPSPGGDRERMYAQRNHDLENAWKMGRTDPARAGQIENQREEWLGK
jgi:hypothetical protein